MRLVRFRRHRYRLACGALAAASTLAFAACKSSISGGAGSGGSIVASIPGIDPTLRSSVKFTFTLNCDPVQTNLAKASKVLTAQDSQDPASTTVSFTNASKVNVGDYCYMTVTDANASDPNLTKYQWTSSTKQAGLFFASGAAQLSAQRSLNLTLYTTYINTAAPAFNPTVIVTLPAGATNTNPAAGSATLTCGGIGQTSNQATAIGTSQISYSFAMPSAQFATAQSCNLSVVTASGTYSATAAASIISTTLSYSNIALQPGALATGNSGGSGSGVTVNTQAGTNCAFDPATQSCVAPTAAAPTPPLIPATAAGAGSVQIVSTTATASPVALTPVGTQGLWMDQVTDTSAPFPSSMYACKGAAIINEAKWQVALGYYCWLMVPMNGYAAGSFVVDIEYLGQITSEANNQLSFNNSNVGCDASSLNDAMLTYYQLQTAAGSTTLALSVGSTPEYMYHWPNSPNLAQQQTPIGCIDQTTGAFHLSSQLQNALLPMMVY